METYTAPMIELLSLNQDSTGYRIEVGVIRNDGYSRQVIEIDEFTYNHLSALHPFGEGRIRLSLYHKWDPFRKTHYSTVIKTNGRFVETLYFPCSEHYLTQLLLLKQADFTYPMECTNHQTVHHLVDAGTSNKKFLIKRTGRLTRKCVIVVFFMLLFFMRMDERLFTDKAKALSQHANAASSANMLPSAFIAVDRSPLYEIQEAQQAEPTDQIRQSKPPDDSPVQQSESEHELIDIERDGNFYSLPEGYVALSFDDGPSKYTKKIVDILIEQKVAATFLFIGKNALAHPDAVTYASEHNMSIGNHSWDHSNLTEAGRTAQKENIAKANQILESLIGSPVTLFRPPYGLINNDLADTVRDQHMKVLLWNRDPEDWHAKTAEDILHYMYDVDPSGGLYVLHEDKLTVEALPEIIKYFKEKNLKFVTFQ